MLSTSAARGTEVEALKRRVSDLKLSLSKAEDRCLELENLFGCWTMLDVPAFADLSKIEVQVLGMMLRAGTRLLTREAMSTILYGARSECDMPNNPIQMVQVYICKLRKKLSPLGISITTTRERGYRLDAAGLSKLEAMVAAAKAE